MTAIRFKELRAEIGVTQAQLAKKLDVHPRTISGWEQGDIVPRWAVLATLAIKAGLDGGE